MDSFNMLITPNTITALYKGKVFNLSRSNPQAALIINKWRNRDKVPINADEIITLFNTANAMKSYLQAPVAKTAKLEITGGQVLFRGKPLVGLLVDRILEFMRRDLDPTPMIKFLENLLENPSYNSRDQLYSFLENGNMPITEDGCFLAYKAITGDWKDKWTQKLDYRIGQVPKMPREDVCDDQNNCCAPGFHAGSWDYAKGYHGAGDRFMMVKINPRDVVCVPAEHGCGKARVCQYEMIAEVSKPLPGVFYPLAGDGRAVDFAKENQDTEQNGDVCPECGATLTDKDLWPNQDNPVVHVCPNQNCEVAGICLACGAVVDRTTEEDAKFCKNCGVSVEAP